jgi:hypothetical protein
VLAGQVEPKAAAVATQIIGAYARLLEFERKVKEQEEFENRLAALEEGGGEKVGNLKTLEVRLARLEAHVAAILDPEEQEASAKMLLLHHDVWLLGGSFEDIPEEDRDPSIWEFVLKYGPVDLEMVWEGIVGGREELLVAGVDFTRSKASTRKTSQRFALTAPPTPIQRPSFGGTFRYPRERVALARAGVEPSPSWARRYSRNVKGQIRLSCCKDVCKASRGAPVSTLVHSERGLFGPHTDVHTKGRTTKESARSTSSTRGCDYSLFHQNPQPGVQKPAIDHSSSP